MVTVNLTRSPARTAFDGAAAEPPGLTGRDWRAVTEPGLAPVRAAFQGALPYSTSPAGLRSQVAGSTST
jgi:hypothetical protein